ncbi:MAG: DUF2066 domain-containing protein [Alphaproteobacteria bacterium]
MVQGRSFRWAGGVGLAVVLAAVAAPALTQQIPQTKRPITDVYAISGVNVERLGATIAGARESAIAEAHRLAFQRLAHRMLASSAAERLAAPPPARLADMVRDVEIADERVSSVRYSARFQVRFKPDAMRALFRAENLPFAEATSRPILLLPVLEVGGRRTLWDDVNAWRDAWQGRLPRDGLVPIVFAGGDVQDIGALTADQAIGGDSKRLKALMERHGAVEAIVALAKLAPEGPVGAPEVQINAVRHGAGASAVFVERLRGQPGEAVAALLARAAEAIARQVEDRWKQDNAFGAGAERIVEATVTLRSLRDWTETRARLQRVAQVRKSELIELSKTQALLRLVVVGTDAQLASALAQQDLHWEGQGAERFLRPAGTAATSAGTP